MIISKFTGLKWDKADGRVRFPTSNRLIRKMKNPWLIKHRSWVWARVEEAKRSLNI